MNANHNIGFENGGPVLTVDFDYAALKGYDDGTADSIKGLIERECVRLTRHFSEAQLNLIKWLCERVPGCSLRIACQPRLKLCIMLLNIRPAELGLPGKPTLTKLAIREGVPKQKLSQLNTDFSDRFGILFGSMKSPSARRNQAARFAGNSKKKPLKPSTLPVQVASPLSLPPPMDYVPTVQMFLF